MPERIETAKYLSQIARSREYGDERQRGLRSEHQSDAEKARTKQRAIRVGGIALANANTSESGYRNKDGTLLYLAANLDVFHHAKARLDDGHDDTWHSDKREVSKFNHALKDAIDKNKRAGMSGILTYMKEAYANINPQSDMALFEQQARTVLVGMQHELAAEQIIESTGRFSVDYDRMDVSEEQAIEDDLHGDDIFVIDNETGRRFSVDIKYREETVRHKRQKAVEDGRDPNKIIWSRCNPQDFTDNFSIDPTIAERKAAAMMRDLEAASYYAQAA